MALFRNATNPELHFPLAENTHRYQDAHGKLYGYVIDGLDKSCLEKLAHNLGHPAPIAVSRTVTALKKLLPSLSKTLWHAIDETSENRRLAQHSVRPPAKPFSAFEMFNRDLEEWVNGLAELERALESLLGLDSETAKKRKWGKMMQPSLRSEELPRNASIHSMREAVGKTISHVDVGWRDRKSQAGTRARS